MPVLRELLPFFKDDKLRQHELSFALFPAAARGRVDIHQFFIDQGANVIYHDGVTDNCDGTFTYYPCTLTAHETSPRTVFDVSGTRLLRY